MDWANERYVRVYTRDSTTWKLLDWRARTVLLMLMRKVNRAGILDVGDHGVLGLAAALELPIELVEPGVASLVDPRIGTVRQTATAFVIPNFLDAQEAVQTTAHRSREYRARQRDAALAPATKRGAPVTKRDDTDTPRDETVTRRHSTSLLSDPIREEISPARAHAIPGSPVPPPTEPEAPVPARADSARPAPDPRIKINTDAWVHAADAHRQLRAAGIDPTAIAWPAWPCGDAQRELVERTRELLERDPDPDHARAVHRRRVEVAIAEAKREAHLRWFVPSTFFGSERFWRAAELSPEQAARRAGPRAATTSPMRVRERADDAPRLSAADLASIPARYRGGDS